MGLGTELSVTELTSAAPDYGSVPALEGGGGQLQGIPLVFIFHDESKENGSFLHLSTKYEMSSLSEN